MTEWIKHDGGPCPVHPETVVSVILFVKDKIPHVSANCLSWERDGAAKPWDIIEYFVEKSHPECPSINERAALNQAITTAMDMSRAGIAQSEPVWTIEESHQTHKDGFPYVDFCVCGDGKVFCTTIQTDAKWLADKLNGKA